MAANAANLRPVKSGSLLLGFGNFFNKEMGQWLRKKTLLINLLLWPTIVAGILAMTIYGMPSEDPASVFSLGAMLVVTLAGICSAISAVITMQGSIIDEKNSGTAAWVLSKPISRFSFAMSKLSANSIAVFFFTLAIPVAVSTAVLQFSGFGSLQVGPVCLSVATLMLHTLFYISFTMLLGTFFGSRGPVIGIPLGFMFGQQLLAGFLPSLQNFLPGMLISSMGDPANGGTTAVALALMQGQQVTNFSPVIATAVMTVVFIAIAVWRFGKEEF